MKCETPNLYFYLWAEVEVAIYGQHGVSAVTVGQRKETMAAGLQKLLQQELSRRRQKCVFTVWSAHILRCTHTHRGLHPLQEKRGGRRGCLRAVGLLQ